MKNILLLILILFCFEIGYGQIGFEKQTISIFHDLSVLNKIDIDNDNDFDFIIAQNNEIFLYENLGLDVSFSQQQMIISNQNTNADDGLEILFIDDVDSDGDEDILVSLKAENFSGPFSFIWYENIGNNTFNQSQTIDVLNESFNIQLFDFDNDGDNDILEFHNVNLSPFNGIINLYENLDGEGTFSNKQQVITSSSPIAAIEMDLDNDGDYDILYHNANGENYLIENSDGNGTFNNENLILASTPPKFPIPADLDGDNDTDLLFTSTIDIFNPSQTNGQLEWYENSDSQGNMVFAQEIINNSTAFYLPNITDMDNDGDNDIVTISSNNILMFENIDGFGSFGSEQTVSANGYSNVTLLLLDIDSDGDNDIILNKIINNQIVWFENLKLGNEINGFIKVDIDNIGCDQSNTSVPFAMITSTNGQNTFSSTTNSNGNYQIATNEGNFITEIQNLSPYFTSTPISANTTFTDLGNTDIVDFCIEPTSAVDDLNITIIPPIDDPRPGFDTSYQIIYSNIGTTQLNGDIMFQFENSKIQFLNASETVASQTSNTLTFNYSNLNPFETRTIDLDFNVFPPPTTNIDDELISTATINPVSGDETQDDNTFELEQTVIGSFDPNDIKVLEGEEVLIDDIDKYLHYIIRFQNTGTASAINVRVEHILDNKLDWTTMQLQSLSHQGRVEITDGSEVQFIFNNINLPYSTTDEPNSHGYIAFKIKPKDDVIVGDIITGVADIYFDFNPPITTISVFTEIVQNLSNEEFTLNKIKIFPNPTSETLNIQSNIEISNISVFDMSGRQLIIKKTDNSNSFKLDLNNLSSGIYLLEVQSNSTKQILKFIKQ